MFSMATQVQKMFMFMMGSIVTANGSHMFTEVGPHGNGSSQLCLAPEGGHWQWNPIVATSERAMSCLPCVWEASVF